MTSSNHFSYQITTDGRIPTDMASRQAWESYISEFEEFEPEVEDVSSRVWSPFQEDIYKFGEKKKKDNLIINAVAGSGKSTTLFELATRLKGRVLFLAFNKNIADYASVKLAPYKNIDCRTFHSYGKFLISKYVGFYPSLEKGKVNTIVGSLYKRDDYRGDFYPGMIVRRLVKKIRTLGMMSYEPDDILEFVRDHQEVFSNDAAERGREQSWVVSSIHEIPGVLRRLDVLPVRTSTQSINTKIDFDDMVRMPCLYNMVDKVTQVPKSALIDESQDMNAYQIHTVSRLYARKVRVFCCGDRLQAIYAFRGSYMDSMDRMKEVIGANEMPLSVTYRCRENIVNYVNSMIPESQLIAHKEGGEVIDVVKTQVVSTVLDKNVKMIVGARNKSLLECWLLLAKNKIASSLKNANIVDVLRIIIEDMKARNIDHLLSRLEESCDAFYNEVAALEEGQKASSEAKNRSELMEALIQIIRDQELETIPDLHYMLNEMEKDCDRQLHTVHSAKGLEASSVIVLCDWFENPQLVNMMYVAFTRASDQLILVDDWLKDVL